MCKYRGFAYLEVMISVVLIGIALIPAADALRAGLAASQVMAKIPDPALLLQGCMQSMLAKPLEELRGEILKTNTISVINGSVSIQIGISESYSKDCSELAPVNVQIAHYDGLNNLVSASYTGLILVKVYFQESPTVKIQSFASFE